MTKKIKEIIYGLGGYDKSKSDNNIVETIYYTDEELFELAKAEAKETAKADLLEKLGITAEEVVLLLS